MNRPNVPAGMKRAFIILFALAILLVAGGLIYKKQSLAKERDARETELALGPKVKVATAIAASNERSVSLSGEARAYANVTLYAKVSGYLKEMRVDKGDKVKKGQILAVIESPEAEQAYQSAQAESKNKKVVSERIQSLLERKLVSQQEADLATAEADMSSARLKAQAAQREYQSIRAPFDGTVTARFADPGALVQNATNAQTGALPLLSVSQIDQLRIYVYLDQRDVPFVKIGTPVTVSVPELPEVLHPGKVARISGQLDEKTRMLLTEIKLDQDDSNIVAGSLINAILKLTSVPGIELPSDAMILRESKTMVALVNPENQIDYKEVRVLENSGQKVKLASGIQVGDVVALGVGNSLAPLTKVRPLKEEAPK
ncbi:MAG: efflux RND transporter periplasmic adaptor subunit [Proteobacteria bacterium]|nr:MAG: efflux RND transporter periplasmic adaptor subunit [Pseudomonadota bacterium]